MNVDELIKKLQNIKPELREKEVFVIAKNGLLLSPVLKFEKKDIGNLDMTKENVKSVILAFE